MPVSLPCDIKKAVLYEKVFPEGIRIQIGREGEAFHPEPVLPRQVHGNALWNITDPTLPPREADGVWSFLPGVALGIRTADCLSILLWSHDMIAALHAGWRGLHKDIIGEFFARARPRSPMFAFLGPCIGPCCYRVGPDVASRFQKWTRNGFLNLRARAVDRLVRSGVPETHMTHWDPCTQCSELSLPSYRREGERASRLISSISPLKIS